jgi:hypothetical protein
MNAGIYISIASEISRGKRVFGGETRFSPISKNKDIKRDIERNLPL